MPLIGEYYSEDLLQTWFVENLATARKNLTSFKMLDSEFDGFRGYESKCFHKEKNAILLWCLPRIDGKASAKLIERLKTIENTLELFNVSKWSANRLSSFKPRLKSGDYFDNLSVITELEVANKLVGEFGKDKVKLYPELGNGKFSDVLVEVNNKKIYLEVGNLSPSRPEKNIQQILKASAKYLAGKIKTTCYMQVRVDTAELVFDSQGKINVNKSVEKLNYEIDMLKLDELAAIKCYFRVDEIAGLIDLKARYENIEQPLPENYARLLNLLNNNKKMQKWFGGIDTTALLKKVTLVKGIIAGKASILLVEIHSENVFPSRAAVSELKSFYNHIVRNIKGHIGEGQIQPKAHNIIMVHGFNWIVSIGPFGLVNLSPLWSEIQKGIFENKETKYLSGVAFFDTQRERTIYMSNKRADASSQLTEEDVRKLGFRWLDWA